MKDLPRQTELLQTFLNTKTQHANLQVVQNRFNTYFQLLHITNSQVALEITLLSVPCGICWKRASTSTGGFRVNCCQSIVCGRECFRKYVYEATGETLRNMEYVLCPKCQNYLGSEICAKNFTDWEIYTNNLKAEGGSQGQPSEPQTFKCVVHYDDMPLSEIVPLSCPHKVCKECVQGHIEAQIADRKAFILCPVDGCTELLTDYHVRTLTPKLYATFQKLSFEGSREALAEENESVFTCPSVNCPYLIVVPKTLMDYTCTMCNKRYCPQCQNVVHKKMTCTEYFAFLQEEQRRKLKNQQDDEASAAYFQGLANKKFRQCPVCSVWIERSEGCKYMTCLSPTCGGKTYFCMECMQKLTSKHGAHKCIVEGYAFI